MQIGKKIKILIVSNTPWDDNNSFGNSFSNIFGGNPNYEIANIYCQPGSPNTKVATRFFQISEKDIVKKLFGKQKTTGHEVFQSDEADSNITTFNKKEQGIMNSFKLKRWQVLFWMRDLIWANKRWKSSELDTFIKDFAPDLIFQPIYYSSYINEIGLYAQKLTGVSMVGYMSDDNYTLKQYSWSPLFWIDRLVKRHYVKKACDASKILYVISDMQRIEFEGYFGKKCKVLYKGAHFNEEPNYAISDPLKLVYTGNLGSGRWKTLGIVARAIKKINGNEVKAKLYITSPTPVNDKMVETMNVDGASEFLGKVPLKQKVQIQKEADVLMHVNSFEKSSRYSFRLSFSTKLVDYFETGHTIMAIGWEGNADIDYLKINDAAIVVTDEKDIESSLKKVIEEADKVIPEYNHKCFTCGKNNHQIDLIHDNLYKDLLSVI